MMDCYYWTVGICDQCQNRHFHQKARDRAPGVFNSNGSWAEPDNAEHKSLWKEALRLTHEDMTTKVAKIRLDMEEVNFCSQCLYEIIDSGPEPITSE